MLQEAKTETAIGAAFKSAGLKPYTDDEISFMAIVRKAIERGTSADRLKELIDAVEFATPPSVSKPEFTPTPAPPSRGARRKAQTGEKIHGTVFFNRLYGKQLAKTRF